MEINRTLSNGNKVQYETTRDIIQFAFRSPAKAANVLEENTEVLKLLKEFEKKYLSSEKNSKTIIETIAYSALRSTPLYKAVQEYENWVAKGKKN